MTLEKLKKPPLVEAIFEIKWYAEQQDRAPVNPTTQLILARLFDQLNSSYPKYEQLPFASIPEEMGQGIVGHQFRSENGWPLVQLGTGVLTVNDTENYTWQDFHKRIIDVVNKLDLVYPSQEKFQTQSLALKYLNALDLNLEDLDIYELLRDKMKFNLSINNSLFEETLANPNPLGLDLQFGFRCNKPKGVLKFRISKAKKLDQGQNRMNEVLLWEIRVESNEADIKLEIPSNLNQWLEEAHSVAHKWFFTLIEGDLLRSFEQ